MVACDGPNCPFEWYHYKCVGLDKAPESEKWYCEECSKDMNLVVSGIEIMHETKEREVTVTGPLPTDDWKSAANNFPTNWVSN